MNRSLLLLLFAALIGVGYWVLTEEDAASPSVTANQEGMVKETVRAAPREGDLMPQPFASAPASRRVEAQGSRRIRVVNEAGEAQPGVIVHYLLLARDDVGEEFDQMLADPTEWTTEFVMRNTLDQARADEEGIAHLQGDGVGMAAVRNERARGFVLFAERQPDAEPIELVVEATTRFRVRVVDAAGEPVKGCEVMTRVAEEDDLARYRRGESPSLRRGQRLSRAITDELGDAWLTASLEDGHLILYPDIDRVIIEVVTTVGLGKEVAIPIQMDQQDPVRLQLPPLGGAEITLMGFPEGVVPTLSSRAQDRWGRGTAYPREDSGDNGVWAFDQLPLDQTLTVQMRTRSKQESAGYRYDQTSFRAHELIGPSVPGERVRVTYTHAASAEIHGRLLGLDGKPIKMRRNYSPSLVAHGRFVRESARAWPFDITLHENGSFIAKPRPARGGEQFPLSDFDAVLIQKFERTQPSESFAAAEGSIWVKLPLAVPAGTKVHEVGDLVLSRRDPVLEVTCVDAIGQGVPDVLIELATEQVFPDGSRHWRIQEELQFNGIRTDKQGVAKFPGFDLATTLNAQLVGESEGVWRVRSRHRDFLPAEKVLRSQTAEIELKLVAGMEWAGKVRTFRALDRVEVHAVDPGTAWVGRNTPCADSAIVGFSDRRVLSGGLDPVTVDFELAPLGDRPYDLVFTVGKYDREFLRLRGVHPGQVDLVSEPVDLRPHLDVYSLKLFDLEGSPIQQGASRGLHRYEVTEDLHGTSGGSVTLFDGVLHCFAPQGEDPRMVLGFPGADPILLRELGPGPQQVRFHPLRTLRLQFVYPDEAPAGAQVSISGVLGAVRPRLQAVQDPGADVELIGALPGRYRLTWRYTSADGSNGGMEIAEFELTAEACESGAVLPLPVPPALFD